MCMRQLGPTFIPASAASFTGVLLRKSFVSRRSTSGRQCSAQCGNSSVDGNTLCRISSPSFLMLTLLLPTFPVNARAQTAHFSYAQLTQGSGSNPPAGVVDDVVASDNPNVVRVSTGAVDFGSAVIGKKSAAIPLTFTFDSGGTIGAPVALTQGVAGLDFAVANTGHLQR